VGGGVAHSNASRIPWQKRIAGTAIQSGGLIFNYDGLKKKMKKNQRGGSTWKYFKRTGDMFTGRRKPQKGGFWGALERGMFGVKRTKGEKKRKPQKGGVLGLDKFSRYYNGKSKKEQQEMDAWAARNL
jgi:hypothetical protein